MGSRRLDVSVIVIPPLSVQAVRPGGIPNAVAEPLRPVESLASANVGAEGVVRTGVDLWSVEGGGGSYGRWRADGVHGQGLAPL